MTYGGNATGVPDPSASERISPGGQGHEGSDQDLAVDGVPLAGLAERLADEDLALMVLTDEELAALEQPIHGDALGSWFTDLVPSEQEVARTTALRSLVARGLLRPGEDPTSLDVHPTLQLLRTCRDQALSFVRVERLHRPDRTATSDDGAAERTDVALYHLLEPGIMLEELLDPGGFHAFTVRAPERAMAGLAAWCAPGLGAEVPAPSPDGGEGAGTPDAGELLASAGTLTTVIATRRSTRDPATAERFDTHVTFAAAEGRCWAIAGRSTPDGAVPSGAVPAIVELTLTDLQGTLLGIAGGIDGD